MTPDVARFLKCPHCGEEKEVLSLLSGNSIGMRQWSDSRRRCPMLPRLSPIQKCPHCGKYFFAETAEERYDESRMSNMDTGELSYEETKEAFEQLNDMAEKDEKYSLCFSMLFAFNDKFYRLPENITADNVPDENDKELFETILGKLIKLNPHGEKDLLTAEFYREKGQYDQCLRILDEIEDSLGGIKFVADQIREHAEAQDPLVFELTPPNR